MLWPRADERSLALAPRRASVETRALHHQGGHQAQRALVLVGALPSPRLRLGGPPGACLTGLQAPLTLHHPDALVALLALARQGAALCGGEAEPLGRRVCAAVSHPTALDVPRQRPGRLPGGVLESAHEGPALAASMLLALAHKIPAISAEALEALVRRIPRVAEDPLGLPAPALPGSAPPREGQRALGRTALGPLPHSPGPTDLPVRPDAPDATDATDAVTLLTRPPPGGFA